MPPTNVARIQFVVGFRPWFFSGYSGFPPSTKANISKFQFDLETLDRRATLWISTEIPIYNFIYFILLIVKCTFTDFISVVTGLFHLLRLKSLFILFYKKIANKSTLRETTNTGEKTAIFTSLANKTYFDNGC